MGRGDRVNSGQGSDGGTLDGFGGDLLLQVLQSGAVGGLGFVGAAESKAALMQILPAPSVIVEGRLGGSAITVAAVNALASRKE